jgi:hypothetical protein
MVCKGQPKGNKRMAANCVISVGRGDERHHNSNYPQHSGGHRLGCSGSTGTNTANWPIADDDSHKSVQTTLEQSGRALSEVIED